VAASKAPTIVVGEYFRVNHQFLTAVSIVGRNIGMQCFLDCPPTGLLGNIPTSNKVGGVNHDLSTRPHAPRRRAPFRSRCSFAFSNPGSLVISQGQELSPTHASLRSATPDHDYYFELLFLEEERAPNQLLGVLVHTMAISGLTRVSTWADGPRNLMKISWSRMHNGTGLSGEIEFAMEKLRPSACLIRSVRD
jgi:hypothetical protein